MAKQKTKVPKQVAGIKIRKRQRKQLRALVRHIDKVEELLAVGTALVAALGLAQKFGKGKGDKAKSDKAKDRPSALAH